MPSSMSSAWPAITASRRPVMSSARTWRVPLPHLPCCLNVGMRIGDALAAFRALIAAKTHQTLNAECLYPRAVMSPASRGLFKPFLMSHSAHVLHRRHCPAPTNHRQGVPGGVPCSQKSASANLFNRAMSNTKPGGGPGSQRLPQPVQLWQAQGCVLFVSR